MTPGSPPIDSGPTAAGGGVRDPLATAVAAAGPAVTAICGLLATACGGVLASRRWAGAIGSPGPTAVVATTAVGILLVAVGDLAAGASRQPACPGSPGRHVRWTTLLTRFGLLLAVAGVAIPPGTAAPLDSVVSFAAVAVAVLALVRGFTAGMPVRSRRGALASAVASPPTPSSRHRETPPGDVVQRLERVCLPGGAECVRGELIVVVPRGARSGSGHVGFCPPFACRPAVDVGSDYDGVEASVSAAEILPWGIRVECRLDEPAEETIEIPVAVLATAPA